MHAAFSSSFCVRDAFGYFRPSGRRSRDRGAPNCRSTPTHFACRPPWIPNWTAIHFQILAEPSRPATRRGVARAWRPRPRESWAQDRNNREVRSTETAQRLVVRGSLDLLAAKVAGNGHVGSVIPLAHAPKRKDSPTASGEGRWTGWLPGLGCPRVAIAGGSRSPGTTVLAAARFVTRAGGRSASSIFTSHEPPLEFATAAFGTPETLAASEPSAGLRRHIAHADTTPQGGHHA